MAWNHIIPGGGILEIEGPQTDLDTEATGAPLVLEFAEGNFNALAPAQIADARQNPDPAGDRAPLQGVWTGNAVQLKTYMQGLKAVADAEDPAALTAQSHLIASAFGATPRQDVASLVGASSSVTKVVDADPGAHAAPDVGRSANLSLLQVQLPSGRKKVRPWVGGATSGDLNLLLALDEVPAEGAELYAACVHAFRYDVGSDYQYPITVRHWGKQRPQNAVLIGAMASIKRGAIGPDGTPMLDVKLVPALVELQRAWGGAGAQPAADPAEVRISAGGELLLGRFGATTVYEPRMRCEWPEYGGWQALTQQGPQCGVQSYIRNGAAGGPKLTLPKRYTPSDFGITLDLDDFKLAFDAHALGSVRLQVLDSVGARTPGLVQAWYAPDVSIVGVADGGVYDGEEAWTITTQPTIGSPYAAAIVLEG